MGCTILVGPWFNIYLTGAHYFLWEQEKIQIVTGDLEFMWALGLEYKDQCSDTEYWSLFLDNYIERVVGSIWCGWGKTK